MKSFKQYQKIRESMIGNGENSEENEDRPLNPTESNDMKSLFKIIRIAWREHQGKTKEFLKSLANSSSEIANELQNLSDKDNEIKRAKPFDNRDEVRAPEADTMSNDFN